MNPADRHLAIRTEDRPLEYVDFEGVIPENQYGAGTVMVWDRGPYEPQDGIASREQLVRGKIDVTLATRNFGCSSNGATSTPIRCDTSKTTASIALPSPAGP
jgi:DNA ligase D-like protein (predicted 3'-phosphoesterase)